MWLKLRWARFFTLAGWQWRLASDRGFDFVVTFPCGHSECSGSHSLSVRVIERNKRHLEKLHSKTFSAEQLYQIPHPALFGNGPTNTFWQMQHGSGAGVEDVGQWVDNALSLWNQAASG